MTKILSIFAACAIVAGCAVQRKSPVWQRVVDAPRPSPSGANTSETYAKSLHATLEKAGVQHKVVTYNYPFHSKFDGHGTAQRTSVIYRDGNSPDYPWWIMDERLSRPIWLPTESVEKQVNFFLRRPAQVVTIRQYGAGDGKTVASTVKQVERTGRVAPTTRVQAVEDPGFSPERASQPMLITRVWHNTKSLFQNNDTTPAAQPIAIQRVAPPAITRIVPPEKPVAARIEPAPPQSQPVAVPVVATKRPLFRPAGVKPRPFFSSF